MTAPPTDRVVVYPALDGWRWHYQYAGNWKIGADSGQGYADRADAIRAAERITHCALVDPSHPDIGGPGWVLPLIIHGRATHTGPRAW